MKPYGRYKKVTGGNDWKIDYHMHEKGRKVKNWWEDICDFYSRSRMKQLLKKKTFTRLRLKKFQNYELRNY